MPPAMPIISASRMPTLTTRSGCSAPIASSRLAEMSATTTATRGSSSSSSATTSMKRSLMPITAPRRRRRSAGRVAGAERALERVLVAAVDGLGRPALAAEPRRDATGPAVGGGRVVDGDHRQGVEADPAGEGDRLVVRALVELAVADQAEDARLRPALRAQPERDADGERETVPEGAGRDLDAGDQRAVGMVAERRVVGREAVQPRGREEAAGGEHRVVGLRAVALRQQEAVAVGRGGMVGIDVEHAVVQHVQRGEGGEGARLVLLVAVETGEEVGSRAVVDRHVRRLELQVHLKSSVGSDGRRTGRAQRRRDLGAPLLGVAGADLRGAHRRQPAALRAGHAAPRGADPGGQHGGRAAPADRRGAGDPPPRPDARRSATGNGSRASGGPTSTARSRSSQALRDDLTSCIGCGCLSLRSCRLFNPGDRLAEEGPGPRILLD